MKAELAKCPKCNYAGRRIPRRWWMWLIPFAKNYYCVLIRTDGFFQIIKVVDRVQHVLMILGCNSSGWKEALNNAVPPVNLLNMGKGVNNVVRVEITDEAPANTYPRW